MSLSKAGAKLKFNLHLYRCHQKFNPKFSSNKPILKRTFEVSPRKNSLHLLLKLKNDLKKTTGLKTK